MKILNNLSIKNRIFLSLFAIIIIIGSIIIVEYNNYIVVKQTKINNQKLYLTQQYLYQLQYYTTKCSNIAFKLQQSNKLTTFIYNKEEFENTYNTALGILRKINTIASSVLGSQQNIPVSKFYLNLTDTVHTIKSDLAKINFLFNQAVILKERLLNPQDIKKNLKRYLEQSHFLQGNSVISLANVNLINYFTNALKNKYKKDIQNSINAIDLLTKKINSIIKHTQNNLNTLINLNNEYFTTLSQNGQLLNVLVFIIGIILAILLALYTASSITKPLNEIQRTLRKISLGELPEYEPINQNNELGFISANLSILIDSLKKTTKFAQELAKGNFDIELTPLSDKDEFRNLLLELRDNLKRAKIEEEKRKIEDYQRRKVSEGLAMFAEILRGHHKDLRKLAETIIINLVRYLNANQGVFFILNDKDPKNPFLELYAAYAWNRKKYLEKRINFGEGLIGAVAVEKFTIYMTDVPEDYIEIKSGTGEADPRAILIVPVKVEDNVLGVIELATFEEFKPYEIELVEKICESIASTLQNIKINERTEELLKKSQQQAEEMKHQEEIMRSTIEELKKAQEENLKKEQQLKKLLEDLEKANQNLKIKDQQLQKEIQKLKEDYAKKLEIISSLSKTYRRILEKMRNPIILFDENGKIDHFNDAALSLWNYERDILQQKNIDDLFEDSVLFKDQKPHEYFISHIDEINSKNQLFFIKTRNNQLEKVNIYIIKIETEEQPLYALIVTTLEHEEFKTKELKKELDKCLANNLEYMLKIESLENFIKQNKLVLPEIDFTKELIKWSDRFILGIETIDKQHQKWIEFINKLYRALKSAETEENLNQILSELIEYTKYHFGFEEKYMQEFGYENIEQHKLEHEKFVNYLYSSFSKYIEQNATVPYDLIIYLKQWVENHVLITDRGYIELFKSKGLK